MPFYRYYQINEKEAWTLIPDDKKSLAEILQKGARRISVLALNTAEKELDQDKVSYRGPFYIDIDNKASVESAIQSTKELVDRLLRMGLEKTSFEVYASGSKGFHIYVHEKAIYDGRAKRFLPSIYKFLAIDLFVPGMDYQVYCLGKGNLFRAPNVQREDGRYKVRILPEELEKLDEATYTQLCSQPRTNLSVLPMRAPKVVNSTLAQMFASAESRWKADKAEIVTRPVSDSLLAPFANDPPQCVRDLAEYKIKNSMNFNRAALQMGIYLARSATPVAFVNSLTGIMANKSSSTSYPTETDRRRHLQGLWSYLRNTPQKQFSCSAMRGVLNTRPCDACSLHDKKDSELETYEIQEQLDGYYIVSPRQPIPRRITSFTLVPVKVIHPDAEDYESKRALLIAEVRVQGEPHARVNIDEACWESRSAFISVFRGIANLMVTASDNDIQTLKHYILRDCEEIEDQSGVTAVGVHRECHGRRIRYTYVEPDFSLNRMNILNTHVLDSNLDGKNQSLAPNFRNTRGASQGDSEVENFMQALINLNTPENMGALLGWFSVCHLKAHLMGLYNQFPLINLWGGRGSGKTKTAILLGFMGGCDYYSNGPASMAGTTLFPIYDRITSSTSVPRILDEFNTTSGNKARYAQLVEAFKCAYNAVAISRGVLSGTKKAGRWGAKTQDFYMRAPICILGEQPADSPALSERLVSVELNQRTIAYRKKYLKSVEPDRHLLMSVGKMMMLRAINVSEQWVEARFKKWEGVFPSELEERVRYNLEVVGLGIDFLEQVVVGDLKLNLASEIAELRAAYIAHYQDLRKTQGSHTQSAADRIIDMWSDLIMLSKAHPNAQESIPASAYQILGDELLIDVQLAFTTSRMYAQHHQVRFEVASAKQLLSLVSGEPYYIGFDHRPELMTSRPVLVLDLRKMTVKGLDPSKFMG